MANDWRSAGAVRSSLPPKVFSSLCSCLPISHVRVLAALGLRSLFTRFGNVPLVCRVADVSGRRNTQLHYISLCRCMLSSDSTLQSDTF